MIDTGRLIALGMLVSFGYAGGFVLSTIASPHLDLKPSPRAAGAGGGGQERASGPVGGGGRGAGGAGGGGGAASAGGGGAAGGGSGSGGSKAGGASGAASAAAGGAGGAASAAAGGGASTAAGSGGARQGAGEGDAAAGTEQRTAGAASAGSQNAAAQEAGAQASDAGGSAAAGLAGPSQPCEFVALAGAKAAAFLSGNSVNDAAGLAGGAALGYFAPRGLWASFGSGSIAVRHWDPKGEALCRPKPGAPQAVVCTPLRVRQCSADRADVPTIGYLMLHEGRWSPVYRGNLRHFPDHIPALDPPRPAPTPPAPARHDGDVRVASAVLDRASAYRRSDAGPDAKDQVFVFAEDGRRLDFRMPANDHLRDVLIHTGWWSLAKGILCQGTSRENAACTRPKPVGRGRIALQPVGAAAAPVELLAVSAADQRAAADD